MWHYGPSLSYKNVSAYVSGPWAVRAMLQSPTHVPWEHSHDPCTRQRARDPMADTQRVLSFLIGLPR